MSRSLVRASRQVFGISRATLSKETAFAPRVHGNLSACRKAQISQSAARRLFWNKSEANEQAADATAEANAKEAEPEVKEAQPEVKEAQPEAKEPKTEAKEPESEAEAKEELKTVTLTVAEHEALKGRVAELKDAYLRALAEAENARLRGRQDTDKAKQFGIQGFAKDLLEVSDTLQLAIGQISKEAAETDNELIKNMFDGFQMTEAVLLKVFERAGLTKIDAQDQKLDPHRHMVIFQYVDPSKEPGVVGQVVKDGFQLHGRIVRPAHVGVIQAPPTPPSE